MSASQSPLRSLAANPLLRREAGALALFRLAEFGPWVAILVYAYDQGGATATGAVSLALLLPTAVFAPFAGPLIDRFGATKVLFSATVAQMVAAASTATALLLGAPSLLVYLLAALTAMALTVTHPAHAVVSPGIARTTDQLVALNVVTGWILSIGLVAAPAAAGAILGVASPGAVYLAGAACLSIAVVLLIPLRNLVPPLARAETDAHEGTVRQLTTGATSLAGASAPREVVLMLTATFLMVGAFDVVVVVLAVDTLDIGGAGAGYLTAAHGVGAVIGALLSFALVGRARLIPPMLGAAAVAAAAFIFLGIETTLVAAFAVAAVTGISRSLLEVTGQSLLQRVTSTEILARVFAFKEGLTMAAWGLGSVAVPLVIAVAGIRGALIFTGTIVPVALIVRLRPLLRVDSATAVPVVVITLLRSLPIFRALPVPAIEGIAHTATPLEVDEGTSVVTQGEPGDRYYAIADGSVDVQIDGATVRELKRGEGFGEIALLHDVPRTATVVATTPVSLVAVDREPFLVAVTGHGQTRERADTVAAERLLEQQRVVNEELEVLDQSLASEHESSLRDGA